MSDNDIYNAINSAQNQLMELTKWLRKRTENIIAMHKQVNQNFTQNNMNLNQNSINENTEMKNPLFDLFPQDQNISNDPQGSMDNTISLDNQISRPTSFFGLNLGNNAPFNQLHDHKEYIGQQPNEDFVNSIKNGILRKQNKIINNDMKQEIDFEFLSDKAKPNEIYNSQEQIKKKNESQKQNNIIQQNKKVEDFSDKPNWDLLFTGEFFSKQQEANRVAKTLLKLDKKISPKVSDAILELVSIIKGECKCFNPHSKTKDTVINCMKNSKDIRFSKDGNLKLKYLSDIDLAKKFAEEYSHTKKKWVDLKFVQDPGRKVGTLREQLQALKSAIEVLKVSSLYNITFTHDEVGSIENNLKKAVDVLENIPGDTSLAQVRTAKKDVRANIIGPVVMYNYPALLKPLARRNDEDNRIIDVFQVVAGGTELCKAYSELVNPLIQRKAFEDQLIAKEQGDDETMEIDEGFMGAMEQGMPPISGLGFGVDRLLMLIYDVPSIRDVVLFPLMRQIDNK